LPQLQIPAPVTQASGKADGGHEHTICNEINDTEQNLQSIILFKLIPTHYKIFPEKYTTKNDKNIHSA
jgi:hypothetical protein